MLSIETYRKYFSDCKYTEHQIEEIKNTLTQLAIILIEEYIKLKRDNILIDEVSNRNL